MSNENELSAAFSLLISIIENTDTSLWSEGEIRAVIGNDIGVNKEKTFAFRKKKGEWHRFMNLMLESQHN